MSLQTRLAALISAIGTDIKALQQAVWNTQSLVATYVNATVSATDVFTGFTPQANKKYMVEAVMSCQSSGTGTGIQFALAGPSSGITRAAVKILTASAAATDLIGHISALNTFQAATASLTTPHICIVQAIVEVGASPGSGNIRIQCKSETAGANAAQVFPGSSMRWKEI